MQKSADPFSLKTVFIAAIVLIVLVVVIGIFSGFFTNIIPGDGYSAAVARDCIGDNLRESTERTGCNSDEKQVYKNFGADFEGKVCCIASDEVRQETYQHGINIVIFFLMIPLLIFFVYVPLVGINVIIFFLAVMYFL